MNNILKTFSPLVILLLLASSCDLQKEEKYIQNPKGDLQKAMDAYPSIDSIPNHQVLTLGTFHFDRSRDGSDIIANEHIDISTIDNQKDWMILLIYYQHLILEKLR